MSLQPPSHIYEATNTDILLGTRCWKYWQSPALLLKFKCTEIPGSDRCQCHFKSGWWHTSDSRSLILKEWHVQKSESIMALFEPDMSLWVTCGLFIKGAGCYFSMYESKIWFRTLFLHWLFISPDSVLSTLYAIRKSVCYNTSPIKDLSLSHWILIPLQWRIKCLQ